MSCEVTLDRSQVLRCAQDDGVRWPSAILVFSCRLTARSIAIEIAARIELAFARFRPTMSNAVPWSGLVRMIGNPSVRFTL